jgi:hypothetical protein
MRRRAILGLSILFATPAFADEPTVTLTASELQAVITAELARAQAAGAIAKIGEALRPKQAEAKPATPEQPKQAEAKPVAPERPK